MYWDTYPEGANERTIKENPYYQMGELIGTGGSKKQYEDIYMEPKVWNTYKRIVSIGHRPYKRSIWHLAHTRPWHHANHWCCSSGLWWKADGKQTGHYSHRARNQISPWGCHHHDPLSMIGDPKISQTSYDTIAKPFTIGYVPGESSSWSPFKDPTLIGFQEGSSPWNRPWGWKIYCHPLVLVEKIWDTMEATPFGVRSREKAWFPEYYNHFYQYS